MHCDCNCMVCRGKNDENNVVPYTGHFLTYLGVTKF